MFLLLLLYIFHIFWTAIVFLVVVSIRTNSFCMQEYNNKRKHTETICLVLSLLRLICGFVCNWMKWNWSRISSDKSKSNFFLFWLVFSFIFFLLVIFSRIYFDFLSITINASMYSGQTCAVATRHKVIGTWDCTFLSIPVFSSLFSNRILIASCSRSNRVERCFD